MKVIINKNFYIETTSNSFDLFEVSEKTKNPKGIGYFTHLSGAIRKVIMMMIDKDKSVIELKDFLVKWDQLQKELTDIYKNQKV